MRIEIRAAIYARVSTDLQEKEQTIQSQLEALRGYVLERGYIISGISGEYIDDGFSGATLDRPGLDRLRDALRSDEMDVVVFHSPDRLARKAVYQGRVLRPGIRGNREGGGPGGVSELPGRRFPGKPHAAGNAGPLRRVRTGQDHGADQKG